METNDLSELLCADETENPVVDPNDVEEDLDVEDEDEDDEDEADSDED